MERFEFSYSILLITNFKLSVEDAKKKKRFGNQKAEGFYGKFSSLFRRVSKTKRLIFIFGVNQFIIRYILH